MGQQVAPFQGLLESGIAVGYVFLPGAQFVACSSPRSRFEPAVRTPGRPVARHPQPRSRKPTLRREIPWILRGIPRASKLLISGLFQKGRVLAQDAHAEWEKLSIFLNFLVQKLPAPVEEDLSKGILESIDMDSYRVEKKAAIHVELADEDAEIEPVPTTGGGHRPEAELDRLSNILKSFNKPVREHPLEPVDDACGDQHVTEAVKSL